MQGTLAAMELRTLTALDDLDNNETRIKESPKNRVYLSTDKHFHPDQAHFDVHIGLSGLPVSVSRPKTKGSSRVLVFIAPMSLNPEMAKALSALKEDERRQGTVLVRELFGVESDTICRLMSDEVPRRGRQMRKQSVILCVLIATIGTAPTRAEMVTPGRFLAISFDIVQTAWAGQPGVYDPNLIFLEFRGGVTFSQNAIATATIFVDGIELGTALADDICSPCSSTTWQFASAEFPSVPIFPNPTIIDFAPILSGSRGVIILSVEAGFMKFGDPPYTENAPVVVFDSIASCGSGCTAFQPVTMDAQNLTYEVTPGRHSP